jgi:hypothetical protein
LIATVVGSWVTAATLVTPGSARRRSSNWSWKRPRALSVPYRALGSCTVKVSRPSGLKPAGAVVIAPQTPGEQFRGEKQADAERNLPRYEKAAHAPGVAALAGPPSMEKLRFLCRSKGEGKFAPLDAQGEPTAG